MSLETQTYLWCDVDPGTYQIASLGCYNDLGYHGVPRSREAAKLEGWFWNHEFGDICPACWKRDIRKLYI